MLREKLIACLDVFTSVMLPLESRPHAPRRVPLLLLLSLHDSNVLDLLDPIHCTGSANVRRFKATSGNIPSGPQRVDMAMLTAMQHRLKFTETCTAIVTISNDSNMRSIMMNVSARNRRRRAIQIGTDLEVRTDPLRLFHIQDAIPGCQFIQFQNFTR